MLMDSYEPIILVSIMSSIHYKRAVSLIFPLPSLRIAAVVGTGLERNFHIPLSEMLGTCARQHRLYISRPFKGSQVSILEATTLQNQQGLGLLTAENGASVYFLEEECDFYIYQSGLLWHAAHKPVNRASKIQHRTSDPWNN